MQDYLRERIFAGAWGPGDRLPHEDELSAGLGVSPGTVRSALRQLAGAGLVVRKQRLGTFVARQGAVGNIAIVGNMNVLASPAGYYYRQLVEHSQKRARAAGFAPKLSAGHGQTPEEFEDSIHLLDAPVARNVVGTLITTEDRCSLDRQLEERGIPCVSIGTTVDTAAEGYCVLLDYAKLCESARISTFTR